MTYGRVSGWGGLAVAVCAWALMAAGGCATGNTEFADGGSGGTTTQTNMGGSGAEAGGTTTTSICGQDCTQIATPPCLKSVCNEGMYAGAVGQCVIVPDEGGTCEDGMFCTINDTCDATGQCIGGPPNDCGIAAVPCNEVSCVEASDSCTQVASAPGAACTSGDMCVIGATCQNGLCSGGTTNDCFFEPVSDDCHVSVCDPADGMCKEQIGNEGLPCTDLGDLCTVNKTCAAGVCGGGQPKNCSQLTQGCVLGVCNTVNGQCVTQNLMNGDPCDDLNYCTNGELCNNGACNGGTPVTTCVDGDGCCPSNCTAQNDLECNIPSGTARLTNGGTVPVQYFPCGSGMPGACTGTAAKNTCTSVGQRVVSHASNGTTSVLSLGATSSCYWSVSYYTVTKMMSPGDCLVGISNLDWSSCCGVGSWHGNTMPFGAVNQTFGYVSVNDSGYVSTNPNVIGATWGCNGETQAGANGPGCTNYFVACTP